MQLVIATVLGYTCSYAPGSNGLNCENDIRLYKANTGSEQWYLFYSLFHQHKPNLFPSAGHCIETSDTTFQCLCGEGWTSEYCEVKINYCGNVTRPNKGVCRPLFLNFTCECLGTSYSGRFCEITTQKTIVYQIVSKSFEYIVILCIGGVVLFIVVMDVLKYGFWNRSSKR